MSQRFFVERHIGNAVAAALTGAEAHHLSKVMRGRLGDEIVVFDGSGREFQAQIARIGKSSVELAILSGVEVDRELRFNLTLAVALPKGDRQRVLVEKLVELGVTVLIPLETERSVAESTTSTLERLRRQVIEASKQCGRNRLMQVRDPMTVEQLLNHPNLPGQRILAHPEGYPFEPKRSDSDCIVAIGPEGGFTHGEVQCAVRSGWEVCSLGRRILRVETAAIGVAARLGMT